MDEPREWTARLVLFVPMPIADRPRISSVLHPMDHGRVVKVTRMGQPYSVYVVAVEHPQKAIDILTASVGQDAEFEVLGRASIDLLKSFNLTEGMFKIVHHPGLR
jgi:hypothetical protein